MYKYQAELTRVRYSYRVSLWSWILWILHIPECCQKESKVQQQSAISYIRLVNLGETHKGLCSVSNASTPTLSPCSCTHTHRLPCSRLMLRLWTRCSSLKFSEGFGKPSANSSSHDVGQIKHGLDDRGKLVFIVVFSVTPSITEH